MSFFGGGFPFGGFGGFPGEDMHSHHHSREPVENTKYYELLEVTQAASCEEIKKAYRKIAMKKHPDRGGDHAEFAEITHAAGVLSDPDKRAVYDKYGEQGIKEGIQDASNNEGMSIFDLLSGRKPTSGRRDEPRKAPDVTFSLNVSLEDVYNGKSSKIAVQRDRCCTECQGKGGSKVATCRECEGRGMVMKMVQLGPGMYGQTRAPCDTCGGEGKSVDPKFKCKTCKGKKMNREKKVIDVVVDQGVPNGHKYTFNGESDEAPGLAPGDLIVVIETKEHPVFKRRKADLVFTKKINLYEALTGYRFTITHLDNSVKLIQSQPGEVIKPGDIKTVEDLGMPIFRTPYRNGNLFINFEVEFPSPQAFSVEQQATLREILPPPEQVDEEVAPGSTHSAITFDKSQVTEAAATGYSDIHHEEEEAQEGMRGGQRVQCSGTIF
jgi:DnaJ-class molecular chaperone